ncbi:reverse transcriptase domain-containing protein [Chloropicon roscoffensis]|uniref:Reverse transcriptase domain-containing protein n=1 Tax=Chloropicon roscoffensis TaxID=1461544 RepID=A0AAX4P3H0_9CHLO
MEDRVRADYEEQLLALQAQLVNLQVGRLPEKARASIGVVPEEGSDAEKALKYPLNYHQYSSVVRPEQTARHCARFNVDANTGVAGHKGKGHTSSALELEIMLALESYMFDLAAAAMDPAQKDDAFRQQAKAASNGLLAFIRRRRLVLEFVGRSKARGANELERRTAKVLEEMYKVSDENVEDQVISEMISKIAEKNIEQRMKLAAKVEDKQVYRLVVDLRGVNERSSKELCSYPRLKNLFPALAEAEVGFTVDVRDAFYHLAFDQKSRELMTFRLSSGAGDTRSYRLRALAMGWTLSPARLVEFLAPFEAAVRRLTGVLDCQLYLDDLIVLVKEAPQAKAVQAAVLKLCQELGLSLKEPVLAPSSRIPYLGLVLNLAEGFVELPAPKIQKLREEARVLVGLAKKNARWLPRTRLHSFVGRAQASSLAFPWSVCRLRSLYSNLPSWSERTQRVKVTKDSLRELTWWAQLSIQERKRAFQEPVAEGLLFYDASGSGHGAFWEGAGSTSLSVGGKFSHEEQKENITWKEARAAVLAVTHFLPQILALPSRVLKLTGDSMAVVQSFVKGSSRSPAIHQEILRLVELAEKHGLTLMHAWTPTDRNLADEPSRLEFKESYRFRFAHRLARDWGLRLRLDLFASFFNRQCNQYCSLLPSPGSQGDAFQRKWTGDGNFLNPPFSQLARVIMKLLTDGGGGILIIPVWKTKPWWRLVQHLPVSVTRMYHDLPLYTNEAGEMMPAPRWATLALRVLPSSSM